MPLGGPFDYASLVPVQVGQRVMVSFGNRRLIGVVVDCPMQPAIDPDQVKPLIRILDDTSPLTASWMRFASFAASYYQRPMGEVVMPALPVSLRTVGAYEGKRAGAGPVARLDRRKKKNKSNDNNHDPSIETSQAATAEPAAGQASTQERSGGQAALLQLAATQSDASETVTSETVTSETDANTTSCLEPIASLPELNEGQWAAVAAIKSAKGFEAFLLFGITGSGKTEVYMRAAAEVLKKGLRVLVLVPEINLTPQFEAVLRKRLEPMAGVSGVAVMHSGLSDGERLAAWLSIARQQARVVLGTRLSIFAPMDDLGLIVVDEEHDASYKQQDGLRYSARDLAVWRARDLNIPVVLGSATPSMETWLNAQRGHYRRLDLPVRARAVSMPQIRLVDTRRLAMQHGLSPQLVEAMRHKLDNKEQVLVFLNRRGYAPVLHCASCGWVSQCSRCTAFMVLHRVQPARHRLHCHHCGLQQPVPRACPDCGDQDLEPMGRGTQRLEEYLADLFPLARISRIDADSTRRKGSAESLFAKVHSGEVDILVGTQMVAKGHDFANLGLVGVLNADAMLFSQDFRAPERLFAQLMQVSGRAGRHNGQGEVIVQTGYPDQPVYQALLRHDFEGFARHTLQERESAGLPPWGHHALLSCEAGEINEAIQFLSKAREQAESCLEALALQSIITLYDPVPLRIVKVANVCRAQLLVEGSSRPALQGLLKAWLPSIASLRPSRKVRWHIEVDPLEI